MCLYRRDKDNYVVSSYDGEYYREIDAKEAKEILIKSGCPTELLKQIMSETTPGFVKV